MQHGQYSINISPRETPVFLFKSSTSISSDLRISYNNIDKIIGWFIVNGRFTFKLCVNVSLSRSKQFSLDFPSSVEMITPKNQENV